MEKEENTNLKKKMMLMITSAFASVLVLMPSVLAYTTTFLAPDLYSIFVERVFGGFWLSVFGLAFVMFVIMTLLGGLSMWTTINYISIFLLAMAIGYTQPILIILIFTGLIFWFVMQLSRFINQTSGM